MNFKPRVLNSAFLAVFIFGVLFLAPNFLFSLGVCLFSAIGTYEFLTMFKNKGIPVYRVFGVAMSVIIPLVVHFQFGLTESGEVLFLILACFCLFLIQFLREESPKALEAISMTFFGMMYVGWFLSFLIKMKFLPQGTWWIFYLFVVTKAADIGAYLIGSMWGKHKLIKHISAKKTIEGTLGGLLFSAIVSSSFVGRLPYDFNVFQLFLMGGIIGLMGQCGDLSESLIKRYCSAKDSGKILPGYGGLLDLMDSVLFTIPLFYFYIKTVVVP